MAISLFLAGCEPTDFKSFCEHSAASAAGQVEVETPVIVSAPEAPTFNVTVPQVLALP